MVQATVHSRTSTATATATATATHPFVVLSPSRDRDSQRTFHVHTSQCYRQDHSNNSSKTRCQSDKESAFMGCCICVARANAKKGFVAAWVGGCPGRWVFLGWLITHIVFGGRHDNSYDATIGVTEWSVTQNTGIKLFVPTFVFFFFFFFLFTQHATLSDICWITG